jgi:hypothetical protein
MLDFLVSDIVATGAGVEGFVGTIRAWVGPILLLIISAISLTFLFKRQISQFVVFILIAVLVAIIFYSPGLLVGIANTFAAETGAATGWGN